MSYRYDDLCQIVDRLLGEGGCPWDRAQTYESLRQDLIEECYEFVDAVEQGDKKGMCEEVGDILQATALYMKIAERDGDFTVSDVMDGICRKMISRHSHVFGNDNAKSADDALDIWEKNKAVEKGIKNGTEYIRSVPRSFPALMRAQKIQKRAEKAGMDFGGADSLISQLEQAVNALKTTVPDTTEGKMEKIGEMLWYITNISRIFKINADFALTNELEKFINRFEDIENSGIS